MNPNPYQPPSQYGPPPGYPPGPMQPPQNRGMFILAGIGALLAAGYWGAITVLLMTSAAAGGASSVSTLQMALPFVLVGLYVYRGIQIFKGDVAAAKRIVFLHILGGLMALLQMRSGAIMTLQGIKVAINAFGAITAYMASRNR